MRITDMIRSMVYDEDKKKVKDAEKTSSTGNLSDRMKKEILSLVPGKTVTGEIVAKEGNEVKIKLPNDIEISAKLDSDINLEVGKSVNFEVKNNGETLQLSPLLTNTANSDTVLKALNMAGLPLNAKTIAMTEKMMQQEMSVDSKSLQNMFKETVMHASANVEDIVNLSKLGMPINDANLSQMESYRNLTHELVSGMTDVLDEIPAATYEVYDAEGVDSALSMYQDIIAENDLSALSTETFEAGEMAGPMKDLMNLLSTLDAEAYAQITANPDTLGNGEVTALNDASQKVLDLISQAKDHTLTKGAALSLLDDLQTLANEDPSMKGQLPKEVKEALFTFAKSESFGKAIKDAFLKQWTIKPEMTENPKEIDKVYNNMNKQLQSLENIFHSHTVTADNPAAKAVMNLSQNIDFLNQLNQMYTYVQLPLKMQSGEKNSELYVFTNKRSLASKDGAVSAMLHLDMDHLGPVDVYVTMQDAKVGTRFMVKNDEMLDFLSDHMHILTERLNKRGYSVNCEMKLLGDAASSNPVETLIKSERSAEPVIQYGFDVRA